MNSSEKEEGTKKREGFCRVGLFDASGNWGRIPE